jgi:hypothetical protein
MDVGNLLVEVPVTDFVRNCEVIPTLHLGVLRRFESLVDEDLSCFSNRSAVDVAEAAGAQVIELEAKMEILLQYVFDRNWR